MYYVSYTKNNGRGGFPTSDDIRKIERDMDNMHVDHYSVHHSYPSGNNADPKFLVFHKRDPYWINKGVKSK